MTDAEPVRPAAEWMVRVNAADLCVQAFGDPADQAILLIGGAAASMDWWEDGFCARLAAAGRYVIRYDHRDTGRSTTFPVGAPTYTGLDLVADAAGVLGAFDLDTAHIVGISMGGALAQHLAVDHPRRIASLTLISTSPAWPGGPGTPDLPPMSEEPAGWFGEPGPSPDWTDRESVIAYLLAAERAFSGAIAVDEQRVRRIAGRVFDRGTDPAAAENHWTIDSGEREPARPRLGEITVPALVLHGTDDPLFPYGHAEALAHAIPGAKLVPLPGMGHQMPPPEVWPIAIPAIIDHTA
jgi:pimeloyl-ACP methyl ester carboxylesterase